MTDDIDREDEGVPEVKNDPVFEPVDEEEPIDHPDAVIVNDQGNQ